MTRKLLGSALALGLVGALVEGAGVVGAADRSATAAPAADTTTARAAQRKPLRLTTSNLFIEINGTDGDAGLQMEVGGEDWRQFTLRDPNGRTVFDLRAAGRLRNYGVTDTSFESAEPPFDEVPFSSFRRRFPEGRYSFTGTTVEGRRLVGSDRLSHEVPARPRILSPSANQRLDASEVVVRWAPVDRPRGIDIVDYIVIVTSERSDRAFEVELGPNATSATVPADYLEPGGEYALEVLARERSGNQTITEIPFRTSR